MSTVPDHDNVQDRGSREDSSFEPIAIIGMAFRFPQGAEDSDSFWRMLSEKRCAATTFPRDRFDIDAFWHADSKRQNIINPREAHFMEGDLGQLDASFFSMTPQEVGAMDPQQRGLLETTYHAFENAGLSLDKVAGSNTSVHIGCFTSDFAHLMLKDAQQVPMYTAVGTAGSILANRLSWYFDLRGESLYVDTACSSGLIATALACEQLDTGKADMAIVGAANIILTPEFSVALSNMNFLSPSGRCKSFDASGDGYGRGEGFATLVLKRVSDALACGDPIRAVIRSVGTNQDGYTSGGITQPSKDMQAALIRETYRRAGLSLKHTRFFEAHGTGTAVGDPIEARAIGETFLNYRSKHDPIYVGAVKSNIGHLEGTSGLASIVKTVLALERGAIPPNANFEKLNPHIDADFLNLKFPTQCTPWPRGELRRASINSFGFGGTNAHVILDSAEDFLRLHLDTCTQLQVPNGTNGRVTRTVASPLTSPELLVLSAADEDGIKRQALALSEYMQSQSQTLDEKFLRNVLHTVNTRRTPLTWKAYAILDSVTSLFSLESKMEKAVRRVTASSPMKLGLVFTGQGAQWAGMGRQLLDWPVFRHSIELSQKYLSVMGCDWKIADEMTKDRDISRINDANISQAIATVLQIGLIELIRHLDLDISVVVGHSSGEIAAAYCAGFLCHASAIQVAYSRGLLASDLARSTDTPYGMLSVGLSSLQMQKELLRIQGEQSATSTFDAKTITISCINSPNNVTVSGPRVGLNIVLEDLKARKVFVTKLKVDLGYHSPQMTAIAKPYLNSLKDLRPAHSDKRICMVSSVTAGIVTEDIVCNAAYWVENMLSPVRFVEAMEFCCVCPNEEAVVHRLDMSHVGQIVTNGWLEVGPHAALKGPLREIFTVTGRNDNMSYCSLLIRNKPGPHTLLDAVGQLQCRNFRMNLAGLDLLREEVQTKPQTMTSLPPYPFNHKITYWEEPVRSKTFRQRKHAHNDLLGTPVMDFNPLDARWRLIIRKDDMPWIEHHKVHGKMIYPAAGMLAMAIEAIKQLLTGQKIIGYEITHASFHAPIILNDSSEGVEVQTNLIPTSTQTSDTEYKFRVLVKRADNSWHEACDGTIAAENSKGSQDVSGSTELEYKHLAACSEYHEASEASHTSIETAELYKRISENTGLRYGPLFQPLSNISYSQDGRGRADILPYLAKQPDAPHHFTVHPSTLDGIFQFAYIGLSRGWSEPMPTLVPSHMTRLWISTTGVGQSIFSAEVASSCSSFLSKRTAVGSTRVFSRDNMSIRLELEALEVTEMAATNDVVQEEVAPRSICRKLEWKPDLGMLSPVDIAEYCRAHRSTDAEPLEWFQSLRSMMLSFAAQALDRLRLSHSHLATPQAHYTSWLQSRVDEHLESVSPETRAKLLSPVNLTAMRQKLVHDSKRGKLSALVGDQLFEILTGQVDPLKVIFSDQALINEYYQEVNQAGKAFDMLDAYLDALCHDHPGQKYLEVGAGTGATTMQILRTLANPTIGARYSEYHYTDISPYFLSHGTKTFAEYPGMKYMILNIEEDIEGQGHGHQSYDFIVAANVLHATKNLNFTLDNTRKLLKPGGKLILMEMTTPRKIETGFVFGLLPGWWLGSEDYRSDGAVITEDDWDSILRSNGFSGCDHVFRDWDSDECHTWSIIVSSTSEIPMSNARTVTEPHSVAIVADLKSLMQLQVATRLQKDLECLGFAIEVMSLGDLYLSLDLATKHVILINGLGACLLHDMHKPIFQALQRILTQSRSVFWVNNMDSDGEHAPYWAMTDGLIRVCRNEDLNIPIASLALRMSTCESVEKTVQQIMKVASRFYQATSMDKIDLDWMEVDGRLCIGRLSKATHVDEYIFKRTENPVTKRQFGSGSPLRLNIKTPGLLDTIEWVEDTSAYLPLEPDDIEVRVQAIGVNFKECLTLLGRVNTDQLGSEASGYVHRVGSAVTEFCVGDRVAVGSANTYKTFVRAKHGVHLPDTVSFVDAASIPTAFCTAYVSLIQMARLQKGETVLIHAAAGGTGQAAVQLAQYLGAEVFVTVGSKGKKNLIMEQYKVPEDHIFYSRDASFAEGIKRMTEGRGVDVVMNSLSGKLLIASWESIASFGRFIEIGRKDIDTRGSLPMFPFIKNTTFAGVDLAAYIVGEAAKRGMQNLKDVFKMVETGVLRPPYPVTKHPINQTEEAFRLLQSGKSSGKMVLEVSNNVHVPVREGTDGDYRFRSDATYVVSGAFGGLGRQICRWLARRGAASMMLLSRSTPKKNTEAKRLVKDLEDLGVVVRHSSCDVSDLGSLRQALEMNRDMPPIKGCFQAAMVLRDRPFCTMQHEEWEAAVRPKVQGSWNLHRLLPSQMDFFVMLSSVTGIVGNPGQSNYAAGNTFQDALARHRVARGEKATALDLGVILDEGYMAEHKDIQDKVMRLNIVNLISQEQLFAMFDYFCHPNTVYEAECSSQITSGIKIPSQLLHEGFEIPLALDRSLFRAMHHIGLVENGSSANPGLSSRTDTETLFKSASSLQEAAAIAAEALRGKLLKVLGIADEERTVDDRMESFGVDSLVALELRNWISRETKADIAVFEILGEGTVSDIGLAIARKSALKQAHWKGE